MISSATTPERPQLRRDEKLSASASAHLDMMRGVAALAVLFGHGRNLFFGSYPGRQVMEPVRLHGLGIGDQAVIAFFVLSGYLIGNSVIRSMQNGVWSWRTYMKNRLTRLWVVLIPALLLTCTWDIWGLHRFGATNIYLGGPGQTVVLGAVASRLTLPAFCGNLFFVQTILVPTFGSNVALWSLSYEFWFYILFPVLATVVMKNNWVDRLWFLIVTALILFFIGWPILGGFVLWMLGIGVSFIPPTVSRLGKRLVLTVSVLVLMLSLGVTRAVSMPKFPANLILASGFSGLLYAALNHRSGDAPRMYIRVANWLSRSSYSLYLAHLPFLVFLAAMLRAPWRSDIRHNILFGVAIMATLVYANLVYFGFEAHTSRVRKIVDRFV
jgi:peptidoglycan/LPS O-acetylase OafA/YrhL